MIFTLTIVYSVTFFFNSLPQGVLRNTIPTLATMCLTGGSLIILHNLIGTPEIIKTITPPQSLALAFCIYTTYKLHRQSREEPAMQQVES